jgi:hypothetical protein
MRYEKLPENMPENLHTLHLSYTDIKNIVGFDVKNLHTLKLSDTQVSNEDNNKLRKLIKNII